MSFVEQIELRDARDHLIDLLGFGNSYPLQDLPVSGFEQPLKIPYEKSAKIEIQHSQKNVYYQLQYALESGSEFAVRRDDDNAQGKGDDTIIGERGNGGTLILETYNLTENATFYVYAEKINELSLTAFLCQFAVVNVGLNVGLNARFIDLPFLQDGSLASITSYKTGVGVMVESSQEGVEYSLVAVSKSDKGWVAGETLSVESKFGNLGPIPLYIPAEKITEDIDIGIWAKNANPAEESLLDIVLPLKVRPNPALPVELSPGHIIDFNQRPTLTLKNSQASARYKVYMRSIPDRDVHHLPHKNTHRYLNVPVPEQDAVPIALPPAALLFSLPDGFEPVADFVAGNGADLSIPLPSLTHEVLFMVEIEKMHKLFYVAESDNDTEADLVRSAVQLEQFVAIFVRPNPAQRIKLRVEIRNGKTRGEWSVTNGQSGIFYSFRLTPLGRKDVSPNPAYFHQWDEFDPSMNKGIGQLTITKDFAVARSPAEETPADIDLANEPPLLPLLNSRAIEVDKLLQTTAKKAMTQVSTTLTQDFQLHALPEIKFENSQVSSDQPAKILVTNSIIGDRYEPFLDGVSVRRGRLGNGESLSFNTDPLTEAAEFEVRITRPDEKGVEVERFVLLKVDVVAPNPQPGNNQEV